MLRRVVGLVVIAAAFGVKLVVNGQSIGQLANEVKPGEQAPVETAVTAKSVDEKAQSEKAPAEPAPVEKAPESRTQKWEYGIGVRAVAGSCSEIVGVFPVPADWPEQQAKIIHEQISPGVPKYKFRQIDGLKQIVFNASQIQAGGSVECYVTYEVTKQAQRAPSNTAELIIPKNPSLELKKYLGNSPLIEATNTKVRSLAREWTEGKETAWEQVQAIREGVREAVAYEQNPKDKNKGVLAVLRDKKADREDLNATFVGVCRAAKIPARMVWCSDFCYAEFYLEENPAADETPAAEAKTAKDKKTKGNKGAWYPCIMQKDVELGVCEEFLPILGKGDSFKVPEEKLLQRWVKLFWTAKGAAKPAAEFRVRPAG